MNDISKLYLPRQTGDAAFYWEGTKQHKLCYQVCNACSEIIFHARGLCPYCFSENVRVEVSEGRGKIYSVSVVHRAGNPIYQSRTPSAVGIVELDEGFHMFTEFIDSDPDELQIGQDVQVEYRELNSEVVLPVFRRVDN